MEIRYGLDPYNDWVSREGIPVVEGLALDLFEVATGDWPRIGAKGAITRFRGVGDYCSMFVIDIPAGGSTLPQRHLYEEVIYVLEGTGSTQIETAEGLRRSFEWGPRSLFAIPLNCPYQLHNGSGTQSARVVSVNTLPIVYSLYRDHRFVFGTDHDFDRFSPELVADPGEARLYRPDAAHSRTAVDLYDTLLVPDILRLARTDFRERGAGTSAVYIETVKSAISNHVCEVPGRRFFNPHQHGPSAYVFMIEGTGYSLMWPDGGAMVRYDWPVGDVGVIVPPNMWWHGHFVTSPNAIQLAVKLRSRFNPINHLFEKSHIPVAEGGKVLRFGDLDDALRERIWGTFVEECKRGAVMEAELATTTRSLAPGAMACAHSTSKEVSSAQPLSVCEGCPWG